MGGGKLACAGSADHTTSPATTKASPAVILTITRLLMYFLLLVVEIRYGTRGRAGWFVGVMLVSVEESFRRPRCRIAGRMVAAVVFCGAARRPGLHPTNTPSTVTSD